MKPLPYDRIALAPLAELRERTGVPIETTADKQTLAVRFAETVLDHVRTANAARKQVVLIMPVGPTGQWRLMADLAADDGLDLSRLAIIQMDEYLVPDGSRRVAEADPFSFTRFVRRAFAEKATRECGFRPENWVAPDPRDVDSVDRAIDRWGGVDVAFAGIGLNGHMAFNEPPGPGEPWTDESFADSPTRIVRIAETTRATNSIFGTGGDLGRVPGFAVTIGMRQILGARRIHVFLDWHWQRFVLRRTLLGPVGRSFPASCIQSHSDVRFTITEEVAEVHPLVPE